MTTQHHQSTTKKRLLSDHQKPTKASIPKPGPIIIPPDDQLLLPLKKTRDLPNLSDCHGCDLHINHTNPKDRLQTLDSVWRIVLLCRRCIKRVELGQICPYCFKESANGDCFKCRDCERMIHKDCVAKHSDSSPWSLCKSELGLGLEFSVCVDCWVPKMFRKSIRIRRRKKSWKVSKKSRINDSNGPKSGGVISRDADFYEGREIVIALRAPKAPRKFLTKDEVCRNAEGLANGAENVVGTNKKDGNGKCGENTSVSKAVGDAELAFELHRTMNRSSRISKNSSFDTSSLGFSRSGDGNGSNNEVVITYKRRKPIKEWKTYKRGCLKRKRFLEIGGSGSSVATVGKESDEFVKKDSDSSCIQQGELKNDSSNEGAATFLVDFDGDNAKQEGISNEKTDRYLIKYSRRMKGHKSRLSSDISENENETSAPEEPTNCSIESTIASDASLNSSL